MNSIIRLFSSLRLLLRLSGDGRNLYCNSIRSCRKDFEVEEYRIYISVFYGKPAGDAIIVPCSVVTVFNGKASREDNESPFHAVAGPDQRVIRVHLSEMTPVAPGDDFALCGVKGHPVLIKEFEDDLVGFGSLVGNAERQRGLGGETCFCCDI